MVNHLEAKVRELSLGEGEVVAQNASQCFDISVWQMLVGLWVGGVTEVVGKEEAASPRRLLEVTEERGVTVLEVVPSMLRAMVEEVGSWRPTHSKLKWLVATGEALPPETCAKWLEAYPAIPVVNAYGPTECSDDVTHEFLREAPKEANTAVGHALPNLQTWVLDKELEVAAGGRPGELYIGGVGGGTRLLGTAGVDGGEVRAGPVWKRRGAAVPDGGLGEAAGGRRAGVPRAGGPAGEGEGLPDRAGRD